MTLTTAQIRQFGVPFRDACIKFASPDLTEELLAAQAELNPPAIDREKPILSIVESVSFLLQLPHLQKAKTDQEKRSLDAMRDHLKFWLESGELIGFGNQVLPSAVRVPRKISYDFWRNASIDREQETAADARASISASLSLIHSTSPMRYFFQYRGRGTSVRK
jgi:hypothetical protein